MRNFTFDADKFVTACVRAWIGREPSGPRDDLHRAIFDGIAGALQTCFEAGVPLTDVQLAVYAIFATMRENTPPHMHDACEAVKAAALGYFGATAAPMPAEVQ